MSNNSLTKRQNDNKSKEAIEITVSVSRSTPNSNIRCSTGSPSVSMFQEITRNGLVSGFPNSVPFSGFPPNWQDIPPFLLNPGFMPTVPIAAMDMFSTAAILHSLQNSSMYPPSSLPLLRSPMGLLQPSYGSGVFPQSNDISSSSHCLTVNKMPDSKDCKKIATSKRILSNDKVMFNKPTEVVNLQMKKHDPTLRCTKSPYVPKDSMEDSTIGEDLIVNSDRRQVINIDIDDNDNDDAVPLMTFTKNEHENFLISKLNENSNSSENYFVCVDENISKLTFNSLSENNHPIIKLTDEKQKQSELGSLEKSDINSELDNPEHKICSDFDQHSSNIRHSIALPPRKRLKYEEMLEVSPTISTVSNSMSLMIFPTTAVSTTVLSSTTSSSLQLVSSDSPQSTNFRSCWKKFSAKITNNGQPLHRNYHSAGKPMYDCRAFFQKFSMKDAYLASSRYFHRTRQRNRLKETQVPEGPTSPRITRSQAKQKKNDPNENSSNEPLDVPVIRKSMRKKTSNSKYDAPDIITPGMKVKKQRGSKKNSTNPELVSSDVVSEEKADESKQDDLKKSKETFLHEEANIEKTFENESTNLSDKITRDNFSILTGAEDSKTNISISITSESKKIEFCDRKSTSSGLSTCSGDISFDPECSISLPPKFRKKKSVYINSFQDDFLPTNSVNNNLQSSCAVNINMAFTTNVAQTSHALIANVPIVCAQNGNNDNGSILSIHNNDEKNIDSSIIEKNSNICKDEMITSDINDSVEKNYPEISKIVLENYSLDSATANINIVNTDVHLKILNTDEPIINDNEIKNSADELITNVDRVNNNGNVDSLNSSNINNQSNNHNNSLEITNLEFISLKNQEKPLEFKLKIDLSELNKGNLLDDKQKRPVVAILPDLSPKQAFQTEIFSVNINDCSDTKYIDTQIYKNENFSKNIVDGNQTKCKTIKVVLNQKQITENDIGSFTTIATNEIDQRSNKISADSSNNSEMNVYNFVDQDNMGENVTVNQIFNNPSKPGRKKGLKGRRKKNSLQNISIETVDNLSVLNSNADKTLENDSKNSILELNIVDNSLEIPNYFIENNSCLKKKSKQSTNNNSFKTSPIVSIHTTLASTSTSNILSPSLNSIKSVDIYDWNANNENEGIDLEDLIKIRQNRLLGKSNQFSTSTTPNKRRSLTNSKNQQLVQNVDTLLSSCKSFSVVVQKLEPTSSEAGLNQLHMDDHKNIINNTNNYSNCQEYVRKKKQKKTKQIKEKNKKNKVSNEQNVASFTISTNQSHILTHVHHPSCSETKLNWLQNIEPLQSPLETRIPSSIKIPPMVISPLPHNKTFDTSKVANVLSSNAQHNLASSSLPVKFKLKKIGKDWISVDTKSQNSGSSVESIDGIIKKSKSTGKIENNQKPLFVPDSIARGFICEDDELKQAFFEKILLSDFFKNNYGSNNLDHSLQLNSDLSFKFIFDEKEEECDILVRVEPNKTFLVPSEMEILMSSLKIDEFKSTSHIIPKSQSKASDQNSTKISKTSNKKNLASLGDIRPNYGKEDKLLIDNMDRDNELTKYSDLKLKSETLQITPLSEDISKLYSGSLDESCWDFINYHIVNIL